MKELYMILNMPKLRLFARSLLICMLLGLSSLPAYSAQLLGSGGLSDHPHNLSSTGASDVRADIGETDQICIFCHTPHNASSDGPLWNRPDITTAVGGGAFPLYADLGNLVIDDIPGLSTYGDGVTQYPNGTTRLCLSCHDGVTAIGTVLSAYQGGNIAPSLSTMTVESVLPGAVVDLSTSHPVSFVYDSNVEAVLDDKPTPGTNAYKAPSAGILDDSFRMQCTSCHDPHNDTYDGTYLLPMWRNYTGTENTDYENTCGECHVGGSGSAGLIKKDLILGELHPIP